MLHFFPTFLKEKTCGVTVTGESSNMATEYGEIDSYIGEHQRNHHTRS